MRKRQNFKITFFLTLVLLSVCAIAANRNSGRLNIPNLSNYLYGKNCNICLSGSISKDCKFSSSGVKGQKHYGLEDGNRPPAARTVNGKTPAVLVDDLDGANNHGDSVLKILAIGNSFSEDALEYYLYGLAKAAGKKIVIGNLYIGGATLKQHMDNAAGDRAVYDFRKITMDGHKTNTPKTSIASAVASENWDFISFQQASTYSGQYPTFVTPLSYLYNYVKQRTTNPKVKYILHQTWAYAQNSTHAGFINYNKDQLTMYSAIVATYRKAKKLIHAAFIVPDGTAVQNGRSSVIGDNYNRDGYHLDLNIGRYTASCTWFEKLFGISVIGNSFAPAALTPYEVRIAQHAAHFAVLKPDAVTKMVDYQGGGNGHLVKPVYVSFGRNPGAPGWNAVTSPLSNTQILNLKDGTGAYVGVSLHVLERFNNINREGAKTTRTDFDIPQAVSADAYYGNSTKSFEGQFIKQSVIQFAGLDKSQAYSCCFFSSRMHVPEGENRETKFIVKGQQEQTALLDAANNSSHTTCIKSIRPDKNGDIFITVTAGRRNNNAFGFYYLNALRLGPVTN